MRGRVGDIIEVINGQGALATASIEALSNEQAQCRIIELRRIQKPSYNVTLALAYCKQSSMEFAIEKATEVGADAFLLFPAMRSSKKDLSNNSLERLRTIIRSATKQCGRLFLPTISIKEGLSECIQKGNIHLFGATENGIWHAQGCKTKEPITLFIGPESGFCAEEIACLTQIGAQGISFSPFTLRAETAAIVGVASVVQLVF